MKSMSTLLLEYNILLDHVGHFAGNERSRAPIRAPVRGNYLSLKQLGKESGTRAMSAATDLGAGRGRHEGSNDRGRGNRSSQITTTSDDRSTSSPVLTTVPKPGCTAPAAGTPEKRICYESEEARHVGSCCTQSKCNKCGQPGHVTANWPRSVTAALAVQDV